MSRLRLSIVSVVALAGCGGNQTTTETMTVATASTVAPPPPTPHGPLGVPRDAIAVATVDLASVFAMFPSARGEMESELDLPSGALSALDQLGYDSKRGMTIAVAALSDDERKLVADVKPLAEAHAPSDQVVELGKRVLATTSSEVRVLFPATDTKKLEAALDSALTKEHWHKNGHGYTTRHAIAELSEDGSWVALDIDVEHSKGSLDRLHATFANARETPPSLDGRTFRATYDPNALAEFGVLVGLTKAAGAVSGDSLDADQRRRIMAEGVFEAEQLIPLSGNAFDKIEITGRTQPFELALHAHAAQFAAPPAPLWADTSAPKIDGAVATMDASRAFVNVLGSPKDLMDRMRNGGEMSALVALPRILLTAPLIASKVADIPSPDAVLQDHFERTGISWTTGHAPIFVGLLPANTTRAAADCALSTKSPCDAKSKLKLGVAVPMNDGFAKLVQVDKRFVVMTAKEASSFVGAVKLAPSGPVHVEIDTAPLAAKMGIPLPLPPHVSVAVANEAGALVIKLR